MDDTAADFMPLDEEARALEEMNAHAMEAMSNDPKQAMYFYRPDTRRIVQTEAEYNNCKKRDIHLVTVPHGTAVQVEAVGRRHRAQVHKVFEHLGLGCELVRGEKIGDRYGDPPAHQYREVEGHPGGAVRQLPADTA